MCLPSYIKDTMDLEVDLCHQFCHCIALENTSKSLKLGSIANRFCINRFALGAILIRRLHRLGGGGPKKAEERNKIS